MKALYLLIQCLSRKEIMIVRSTLQNFYSQPHLAEANMIALFELLLRRKSIPDPDFVSAKFFQKSKDNTLRKLSSRLKSRILDILISEANNEKHSFEQLDFFAIKIRKKLAQFYHLLFSKGNGNTTAHSLLVEIINLSIKYESYPVLVEALRTSKYFKGFINGIKEQKKTDEQILFYEYCNQCVHKAMDYYNQLIISEEYSGAVNESKTKVYLQKSISELKKDFKKTKSAVVGYYLHQLELAYFLNENSYQSAHKICNNLIVLLNSSKSIYKRNRMAFIFGNLAQCDIYIGNFDKAVENAENAQKLISKNSINFLIIEEVKFHALFYGNKIKEAQTKVEELLKKFDKLSDDFRCSKYEFFYANAFFKGGSYKKALNLLNKNSEISKDKPGWDISLRILKIMSMIELEQFDQASRQVESLRKHLRRHSPKETGKRNQLIFKILTLLDSKGFNFNEANFLDKINLLAGDDKKYRWEYMTPELVPFHIWLKSKLN